MKKDRKPCMNFPITHLDQIPWVTQLVIVADKVIRWKKPIGNNVEAPHWELKFFQPEIDYRIGSILTARWFQLFNKNLILARNHFTVLYQFWPFPFFPLFSLQYIPFFLSSISTIIESFSVQKFKKKKM